MKIIITESQLNRLIKEVSTPCKDGAAEDKLITLDDIRNGKVIEKGYCNSNTNSAIVKIQNMLIDKDLLDWDGDLGYYGDLTQDALEELYGYDIQDAIGKNVLNKLESYTKKTTTKKVETTTSTANYDNLTETQKIIVITLIGEAGTEGYDGMKAVANVIKNRADNNFENRGSTIKKQILSKKQFSMWNSHTVNGKPITYVEDIYEVRKHSALPDAIKIAKNIESISDNTNGSTHYYTGGEPWWTKSKNATWKEIDTIGAHTFGKLIPK
jgi:spore germination cell wall hydrolase CwlJ-like protein